MPELPDVVVYVDALRPRVVGRVLQRVRLVSPFVLRSVEPQLERVESCVVADVRRLGKQIILCFEHDLFLAVHLMIAGRFQWRATTAPLKARIVQAAFEFEHGTLYLTEASSKKRAALRLVLGKAALSALGRGGVEPLETTPRAFASAICRENHTLRRALTDPRIVSGIGGAYSDEILHRARLSPLVLTSRLDPDALARLFDATRAVLTEWTERLRRETGETFPSKVTAFHPAMAVHGKFGRPCPACGSPIQRIVYAQHECNYCATCQTGGRRLADRALSRLLKDDWPRDLDDWDAHLEARRKATARSGDLS
jgi:formamidopyrimidine-DNA glycosylase